MIGDWVLIAVFAFGTFSPEVKVIGPVYFHDKAACEAALRRMGEGAPKAFGGNCLPTRSLEAKP